MTIHLILYHYGTHTHPEVLEWLEAHPHYRFHLTPQGLLVQPSGAAFCQADADGSDGGLPGSARELGKAIKDYVRAHN